MQTDYKDLQKLPKSDIWSLYNVYIGVCFCLFNVWWVCMQILQARAHEGILAKHLRNSTRSTMKLITSLVIGACWCNISWHLHKAPSCSFQPKKKLARSRKSAQGRRKSRDSEVNTAKRYQKISENGKHIKTLTVFEYVLRRLGLIHRYWYNDIDKTSNEILWLFHQRHGGQMIHV